MLVVILLIIAIAELAAIIYLVLRASILLTALTGVEARLKAVTTTAVKMVSRVDIPRCQFCNAELGKVVRRADGFWCCPACSVKHFGAADRTA